MVDASAAKKEEVQWHKLVNTPEVFGPNTAKEEREQFPDWKHKMIKKVESARETPFPMKDFTPRIQDRSKKFYSILASYTKKPWRVLKAMTHYNGLEAWRSLLQEHQPYTCGRGLALLNNVLNHKFDSKQTHLENLVAFEEAIRIMKPPPMTSCLMM